MIPYNMDTRTHAKIALPKYTVPWAAEVDSDHSGLQNWTGYVSGPCRHFEVCFSTVILARTALTGGWPYKSPKLSPVGGRLSVPFIP